MTKVCLGWQKSNLLATFELSKKDSGSIRGHVSFNSNGLYMYTIVPHPAIELSYTSTCKMCKNQRTDCFLQLYPSFPICLAYIQYLIGL